MIKKTLLLGLLCAFTARTMAQLPTKTYADDEGLAPREHNVNFTRLRLELAVQPEAAHITGKVTHYFTPLRPAVDSIFLDGVKMTYHSVLLNGKPVKYRADSTGITIIPEKPLHWNTEDSLTINYEANPRRGLYFIGWNDKNNLSQKQVWSQGEATDNRCWIPLYDDRNDKIVSEMLVKFDKDYKVLSNGQLLNVKKNTDGTNTWHYLISHPQAPYLIMLGIGKYNIKDIRSVSGVPIHLYYYPEWKNRVEPTYKYAGQMVDFYEKEIGIKYPWESYSQIPVQDYMFGAMENTTATIFGDFYMADSREVLDRNYVSVDAHELAHQWFGDYVTAKSETHQWLQESFASYYSQLFEREVYGDDYFAWSRRGSANSAIDEAQHNKLGVANSSAGGTFIYGKGSFVLNMLKYVVGGREAYNKAIKHYLQLHSYQNVDTHDLLTAFEESTGMSLEWFWDEWLYRGGEPHYRITLDDQPTQTELVIAQTQEPTNITGYKNGLFKMPVWIELHYEDKSVIKKQYWIQQQTEVIKVPEAGHGKLAFVLFDPGSEVLKTVSFAKPFTMLQAQALGAEQMLDRFDAVAAMRGNTIEKKRASLIAAYHKEKFYPVKNEVLSQLAADTSDSSIALFKKAFGDADVNVRKAALSRANAHVAALLPGIETMLTDSSYSVIEIALQKLFIAQPAKIAAYLKTTQGVEGNRDRNVQIKWLELSFMTENKPQYAEELVKLTSGSYEFRTRISAVLALKRLNWYSDELTANLVDAILNANDRLSGPATDLLKYFYTQYQYKQLISKYIKAGNWKNWQKEQLVYFTK
jgi:aminopeptidase N